MYLSHKYQRCLLLLILLLFLDTGRDSVSSPTKQQLTSRPTTAQIDPQFAAFADARKRLEETGSYTSGSMGNVDAEVRHLYSCYVEARTNGQQVDLPTLAPLLPVDHSRITLDLIFATEEENEAFAKSPVALRNGSHSRGRLASGRFHIDDLFELSEQPGVRWIRAASSTRSTGATFTAGDGALKADVARQTAPGYTGAGITVGVLSDSYDISTSTSIRAANDIATGDLPPTLVHLTDFTGSGSDEGRAMMQIVADLAPDAALAFHTAYEGQVPYAEGIETLREQGCDIIVDDVIYFAEPMFQDGVIAQAIETVVEDGAIYFSAAGNTDDSSWEDSYRANTDGWVGLKGGPLIDFDSSSTTDVFLGIKMPVGSQLTVVLQWTQPFASVPGSSGATSDFDLFLTGSDSGLNNILMGSTAPNTGLDALEFFTYNNYGSVDIDGVPGADTNFHLAIEHVSGPAPEMLKIILFRSGGADFESFHIRAPTLYGHANAEAAMAVAASAYNRTPSYGWNPALVENFSSTAGIPLYFDDSGNAYPEPIEPSKPDFTATDGGNTTFFGNDISGDSDTYPNFFGTSASAPHAAGVAALLLQKAGGPGSLNYTEMRALLQDGALDMSAPGFDNRTGAGLIQVDASLAATQLGFPAWKRLELPAAGSLTLETDTDEDLLPDVLEYFLGTSPTTINQSPFEQTLDGDRIILEFSSAPHLSAPVSLVEVSTNLVNWDPAEITLFTDEPLEELDTVRYEIPKSIDSDDTFIRITPVTPLGFE